ncbi:Pleckstrin y domain containing, F (With FYVE domain) member [Chamberlinius hualienensis]
MSNQLDQAQQREEHREEPRGDLTMEQKLFIIIDRLESERNSLKAEVDELKIQLKSDEKINNSCELEELRSTIADLKTTVRRLESEKSEILQREENLKNRFIRAIDQARHEGNERFDNVERLKDKLMEVIDDLNARLKAEKMRYDKLENSYHECLDQIESRRNNFIELQHKYSRKKVNYHHLERSMKKTEEELGFLEDVMEAQESLVEYLANEVADLKETRSLERKQQQDELDMKTLSLTLRDEECNTLCEELIETTVLLDEKIKENNSLSFSVDQLKAERVQLLTQINERHIERLDLKQHLAILIKNKVSLWQHNEHVAFIEKLLTEDRWVKDSEVQHCKSCQIKFSFTVRKLQCNHCGCINCKRCCSQWMTTASHRKKVRVCNDCFKYSSKVESKSTVLADELAPTGIGIESSLITSLEHSYDELSLLERIKKLRGISPSAKSNKVIQNTTQEDIARCMIKLSPYSLENSFLEHDITSEVRSIDDIFSNKSTNSIVVLVSARSCNSVPILIEKNINLIWEFSSEPKAVSFHVLLEKISEDGIPDRPVCYMKLINKHCNLQKIRGTMKIRKPGVYYFCFDNKFSKFTANKVTLTLSKDKD